MNESDEQTEAKRLLDLKCVHDRQFARRAGVNRNTICNIRNGHKKLTVPMSRRVIKAFLELSKEITPRVNNERD